MVYADTAKEIDAGADEVMDRFYKQVKDAKQFAQEGKGIAHYAECGQGRTPCRR